jgi:hypothetical protein
MDHRELKDTALLIGFNPEGGCVYSTQMSLGDYWDGEHPWDTTSGVQELRLEKVRGYLFDDSGDLLQEFETIFDLDTGSYTSGWTRHSDGTYQEHAA